MARCSSCNKFVSIEQIEPEVTLDIDQDSITGDVRLALECAECGQEILEAELSVDETIEHDCPTLEKDPELEPDYELEDTSAEFNDRYDGKPDTPSRYRRHYYGANITCTIKCKHCGASFTQEVEVEERASSFTEC